MNDLSGKTAVITGAASGIGFQMAKQAAEAGMNVVLADIEAAALDEATVKLSGAGHDVMPFQLDVRHHDEIQALETAANERFGAVHLLCNNAGVGAGGPVADPTNLEAWRWTIDVNLWGVIYGCKTFLPGMIEHGEPSHIVNTASMAGLGSAPMMGAYNISKYGVVALSETMSKEMQLMKTNVGVSVLCPAFVATGIALSDRNMPDDVRSTLADRPATPSPTQDSIVDMVAAGLDPEVIGRAVLDAVRSNRFWILTHPETLPFVTERADDIVNGVNPSLRS